MRALSLSLASRLDHFHSDTRASSTQKCARCLEIKIRRRNEMQCARLTSQKIVHSVTIFFFSNSFEMNLCGVTRCSRQHQAFVFFSVLSRWMYIAYVRHLRATINIFTTACLHISILTFVSALLGSFTSIDGGKVTKIQNVSSTKCAISKCTHEDIQLRMETTNKQEKRRSERRWWWKKKT